MNTKKIVSGVALLVISTAAAAQDGPGTDWYAGVGIGQLTLEDSAPGIDLGLEAKDTALLVFGGYRLNRYFAVEASYINSAPEDRIDDVTIEIDTSGFEAALIGGVPVGEVAQIYARAGVLSWEMEIVVTDGFQFVSVEDDGTDFAYGVGGSLQIGNSGEARLEWRSADIQHTDVSLIMVSGLWKF